MVTLFWLFFFVDGCTVMICLFVIYAQTYLISGEKQGFIYTMVAFLVFSLLGIGFCFLVKNSMTEFMTHLANDHDIVQEAIGLNVQGNASGSNPDEKIPKEKKPIEIPEFLFKYSSTFFKTATKKDVLFKKLFSPEKAGKKGAVKAMSDRFKNKDTKEAPAPQAAKSLKKTDLSMINFHLNIQDNDQLMKHYRSMSYHRNMSPDNKLEDKKFDINEAELKPDAVDESPSKRSHQSTGSKVNESMANLCSVCFANEPDSVFMRCGHGGLCYECSIDIWKKSSECYLCREEIEQILQVEPQKDEKGNEFLKVIASTQLVDEDEPEEQSSKVEYIH